jgi:anti-anti-sigma regulatory factor
MGDLRQADLSGEVLLDAEDVIHFGALCTQTIMAASVAAKEAGGKIKLTNVNDKATGQLGLMGLSPESLTEVS